MAVIVAVPEPLFLDSLGDAIPRPIVLRDPMTRTSIIALMLASALLGAGAWAALTKTTACACSARLETA